MYENRNYLIFAVTEIDKIDFSQVCETSPETLRRSTDGTKSFIKWDEGVYDPTPYQITNAETNEIETITPQPPGPPSFVADLETAEGPYSHSEILEILSGEEWTKPMEEIV